MKARQLIAGKWTDNDQASVEVYNPYSGDMIGRQCVATEEDVRRALQAAHAGKALTAAIPIHERARILKQAAALLAQNQLEFARIISREIGKPLKNTLDEVSRSIETLELSGEEAKRLLGESIPGGASGRGEQTMAVTLRVPVGVVAAITPFNAPLNLICHKVGPAFAAGNSIVLKPAPQAPFTAVRLLELLLEAGMPPYCVNMVLGGADVGAQIVRSELVNVVSFTGSARAGEQICRDAGMKKVLLELGGNAATIVHEDANLARAAALCARTGFSNSGQSCISVQRIYVHQAVASRFADMLLEQVSAIKQGVPLDPDSDVGSLVDEQAAIRVEMWIQEAVQSGGELLCGGKRRGAAVEPTVIYKPSVKAKVVCEEVFGPLVVLLPYASIDEAIEAANDSQFGLQAGLFTNSIQVMEQAIARLEVGGVVINGTSNFRLDHWPYGGIKQSGIGREGPRYAIEDMTETKMIVYQGSI